MREGRRVPARRGSQGLARSRHDPVQGSDDPETDRNLFLKAQIFFWLLGATHGHAKNFSLFLRPGGRFVLTPLYDVMSAQPAVDAGQLCGNQMKLAMAVGESRHYGIGQIMPRHFIQSAEKSGMSASEVQQIFAELIDSQEEAVNHVCTALPAGFPEDLADSIIEDLQKRLLSASRDVGRDA